VQRSDITGKRKVCCVLVLFLFVFFHKHRIILLLCSRLLLGYEECAQRHHVDVDNSVSVDVYIRL
jgi:hypothetical protein